MRLRLRLTSPAGSGDHILLTADPETPVSAVVDELARFQPGPFSVRNSPLDGSFTVGDVLRDGDVVHAGDDQAPGHDARGLELAVVGGPLAGQRFALARGVAVVGRAPESDVTIPESSVSRRHVRLTVGDGHCVVDDLGSRNGTGVDGIRIERNGRLDVGGTLELGAVVLQLRRPESGDADVTSDGAGGLEFNRPARIRRARPDVHVTFPAPPSEVETHPFPWAQVVLPLLLAGAAAVLFKRPEALLFAFMSPVLALASTFSSRRRGGRKARREQERYDRDTAAAQRRVDLAAEEETEELKELFPDPSTTADIAAGPGRRLWERRGHDLDAAVLRVGLADRPASVLITSRGSEEPPAPPPLYNSPVTVDLAQVGVLGIAGPLPTVRAVARWLVSQLAVLRSPRDLQLVVLSEADAGDEWDFVRWLPHARTDDPGGPAVYVGNDRTTREDRAKDLVRTLEQRLATLKEERGSGLFLPSVVVVLDNVRALRSVPGVQRVLKEGPSVGIFAIGLDTDANRLAEEGKAELVVDPSDATLGILRVEGEPARRSILLDQVEASWADRVGRALCPLRDTGGGDDDAVIPGFVRFVDLAGLDLEHHDGVVARWALGGRTTEALVGVGLDGPFALDLKRDGPHGLVAGTTGAGKSEFLQTLVASLAIANLPTSLNFVLVDYKGGSAFAECAHLPHTTGMVTNLDGHLTERALVSLNAELKRRERTLGEFGAPDVDAAWERDPERAAAEGLARLVIVIDEFAELVQELPDFVTGLIRVARVGRSLGLHLILATQRPAGVVTGEMRANTGLRVGLRMVDRNESLEVLEAPDAASVSRSTPGRAYVRTGGGAAVVPFQTARIAGRRKGVTEGLPPPHVASIEWERLGYPVATPSRAVEADSSVTDLAAVVRLVRAAAEQAGVEPVFSPLLPPLPSTYVLDDPAEAGAGLRPAVFGLEDLPGDQRQSPAVFGLESGAHLLLAGSARSGRSTALRTIAASTARSNSPSDVHIYGLDFGNGALLPLAELPHCGAVCGRTEADRIERLVARLGEEVSRRQELLARAGLGDIEEQRTRAAPEERLPYIVLLIDRWEGLIGQFGPDSGSELPAAILSLVREGPGVGLRVVIAGDRSVLTDRIASQIEDKILLRLNDREDYRIVNLSPKAVPDDMPPGRGLRAESAIEVQIGLLSDDASGQGQGHAVSAIAGMAAASWPAEERHNRPFKVDRLPSVVSFDVAWDLGAPVRGGSPFWVLVGVGGDELSAYGLDLAANGRGFVIGGPARSGRSAALVSLARSLLAGGVRVVALCPRPSPLESLEGLPGVAHVFRGEPELSSFEASLEQLAGGAGGAGPVAFVVDDAEALARTPADDALVAFLRANTDRTALVVAGSTEELKSELRGFIVEARKAKAGLLLSPQSTFDGELVGVKLARNQVGKQVPGRGLFVARGDVTVVQTPV